ncbi:MAG: hypothetical protein GC131_00365 [Alphaproteobacteria bacterium]|nr:hypothetical protein [Alphaproteobacteria bacterium]
MQASQSVMGFRQSVTQAGRSALNQWASLDRGTKALLGLVTLAAIAACAVWVGTGAGAAALPILRTQAGAGMLTCAAGYVFMLMVPGGKGLGGMLIGVGAAMIATDPVMGFLKFPVLTPGG